MEYYKAQVEPLNLKSEYELIMVGYEVQICLTSAKPADIIYDVSKLRQRKIFTEPIEIRSPFVWEGNGSTYGSSINLSNCVFKGKLIITNHHFPQEVTFNDVTFLNGADFSNTKFDNNVRFHRAVFHEMAEFKNTTFNNLVDFFLAVFKKDQQFHLTDFNGIAIFSNTSFYNAIQFLHNKVSSSTYISFESAKFYNGVDLSRSNFLCKLKFWGVTMHNLKLESICTNLLYMYDNEALTNEQDTISTAKKIRESMRMIKQAFRADHNNIEALHFHKLELACYKYEIGLSKNKFAERRLLWLNSISNSHGTSWTRGLGFTLLVTLIFYLIFILVLSPQLRFDFSLTGIVNFIRYFIQLLNITNWKYQPFGLDTAPWGDIVLYTGRIFISYGYYQLIQAFRKYTKN